MKYTLEEAAREYYERRKIYLSKDLFRPRIIDIFKAGAEWQAKQSPWIKIGDRENPMPNDKPCLLLLEDGSVVDDRSDWEEKYLMVVAWMPIPSFDEILEDNKDVLTD